jgi:hypothetical protein
LVIRDRRRLNIATWNGNIREVAQLEKCPPETLSHSAE